MEFLPIPENYYYDLGARFGLEDAVLSRMAEFNILYDEDERGSYHHLYTRAFAKRFFFEIVQRHGYDGYGARDTAIRLAAQSRFRNLAPGDGPSAAAPVWVYCRDRRADGAAREEESWMASRKKKAPAKTGGDAFANDAERSKADILAVATEEFATYGLSGARVDAIAKRTRTSKRMIYYYFKGKEGLYRAVLEKAYSEIRSHRQPGGHRGCRAGRGDPQDRRDHVRLRRNPSVLHQPGGRRERAPGAQYRASCRRSSRAAPA